VQEEGSLPGMQWRAPQAVCTSGARKIRVPLVARQRRSLSAGLVSLLCAERGYGCFRGGEEYQLERKIPLPTLYARRSSLVSLASSRVVPFPD
jgi:hypothetical protein